MYCVSAAVASGLVVWANESFEMEKYTGSVQRNENYFKGGGGHGLHGHAEIAFTVFSANSVGFGVRILRPPAATYNRKTGQPGGVRIMSCIKHDTPK